MKSIQKKILTVEERIKRLKHLAQTLNSWLLKFLIPMAGTRNILVHGYDRIDDALIYGIIQKHLPDFEQFIAQVRSHESLDGE
jgi:uncharacterized protein YutE (UPF0331/DUF86 family)